MGMIDLNVELLGQLTVDGLDDLADRIERASGGLRRLVGLVATRQGHQAESILSEELVSQISTDVAFVAKDGQIGMLGQQFSADVQVGCTGTCQFKIQDQPAQTDQQMQLEAEDSDFLAGDFAEISAMSSPIARRARYQMEFDHGHRQRVNGGLPIRAQVQPAQHRLSNNVEGVQQRPTPTVKATLRRNIGKQVSVFAPVA